MQQGKKGIIYKYTSPSGKIYIGQTVEESTRKYKHKTATAVSKGKFGNAIQKYGFENLTYEVLFETKYTENFNSLKRVLDAVEIAYIEYYNSYNAGYNSTKGGGGILGFKHSDKTKKVMSEKSLGIRPNKETREKMSTSAKQRKHSNESKEKMKIVFGESVNQYTKDGIFIKEWPSGREAERALNLYGGAISKVCNGKLKTSGGFVWERKEVC